MMTIAEVRPAYAGVYQIADAAALIRTTTPSHSTTPFFLSTQHLFRWVKEGLSGRYLVGIRGDAVALTFLDLVTMRLVAVFRALGASPREIRIAHHELQQLTGASHPFATEPLWNEGRDIFYEIEGIPFIASRRWQRSLEFIEHNLKPVHNLTFRSDNVAETWEPARGILLDPSVSFGEPCIKGTRIPTEVLWALHEAGDSVELIAKAYEVPKKQVEAALAWEKKVERFAA